MIRPSSFHPLLVLCASLIGFLAARPSSLAQKIYSQGDPTASEQLVLEVINRARANPAAEGQRLGQSDFGSYPARPPLAFNASLYQSAQGHNADMADNNFFSHTGSDGSTPLDRVIAAGYPSNAYLIGENISDGYPSASASEDALMIDAGESDLGHRRNLLEYDVSKFFYREIGVAYNSAHTLFTQDFATRGVALITGVAFQDANGNDFYAEGEGVSGVTVTSPQSSYTAVTSTSGGYALPMDEVGSMADGVTVNFSNAAGAQYSRHLALANTTGDGAPDNVECNVRVGIDLVAEAVAAVSVKTVQKTADAATGQRAVVEFDRAGNDLSATVTVNYKAKGSAVSGVDYKALSGTLTIPAGSASAKLKIKPRAHDGFPAQASLKITVLAGSGYSVGDPAKAKVLLVGGQ